jgi:hypothetical protein
MKLRAVYTDENEIPQGFRELYEEQDGKFVLKRDAIEGVKTQADLDRVEGTLKKERKARTDAEAKLKRFEALGDRDPDELLRAADEVESLRAQVGAGDAKSEEVIQKRIAGEVAKAVNPLQRELDKFKGEAETHRKRADELDGQIRRSTLEAELTKAATGLKVRGEAVEDILRYQDIFEVGEDGRVVTRADLKGVSAGLDPQGWLSERRQDRPHGWPDSVGGGAIGGSGGGAPAGNPFAKASANLTKASQLIQTDRPKAEAYARAAGFPTPEAAAQAMAVAAAATGVSARP